MRVAYLHYLCDDFALHHVQQFADAARGLGHLVDVYAMNLSPKENARDSSSRRLWLQLRESLKRRLGRYLHEPKELAWNARYLALETELLESTRPDVMLVRDHMLTVSCVGVARRLELPLVIELNAPAEESRIYFHEYFHLPLVPEWLEAWKLRRADAVTVVSSALRDHIVTRYSLPATKITVVPNGADLERFSPSVPRDCEFLSAFGEHPVVGFVGSFQGWHGSNLLTRLITRVAAARPAVRFLLVGHGPDAPAVREETRHLGDRVRFTGRVPHERVPGLVSCLHVAVMPESNFYGSPLKVIEWMASGRGIVAPAYGPLEDVIQSEVHGLLFPPRNADALVESVLRLLDDPALARKLGEAAAARARSSLSWTDNARRVLAACEKAAQRRRASASSAA